jgi:stearoyl-CoA desaturase (delta-9 desaturase)
MSAVVALPFIGCVAAIVWMWYVGWMGWLYLSMLLVGAMLTEWGITIGFHRLLTHRSFETHRWLRAVWTSLGALAVQGSPLVWCAVHRKHHQASDQEGDPHSPVLYGRGWWNAIRGFVHAHTGWLFSSHWSFPDLNRYVPDLLKDRLLVGVDRMYYVWVILSLALPAALGGLLTLSWTGMLLGFIWGGLVRIFVVQHITFSINSLCHMFGRRTYQTGDDSRNNVLCGFLAQGEGWHNNHHAFPTSARHGLEWWQLDTSWLLIRGMQRLGLAWNVQLPSPELRAAIRLSGGRR